MLQTKKKVITLTFFVSTKYEIISQNVSFEQQISKRKKMVINFFLQESDTFMCIMYTFKTFTPPKILHPRMKPRLPPPPSSATKFEYIYYKQYISTLFISDLRSVLLF